MRQDGPLICQALVSHSADEHAGAADRDDQWYDDHADTITRRR